MPALFGAEPVINDRFIGNGVYTVRVAINGFGRIGRTFFRSAIRERDISIVAINDLIDADMVAHLLKYDSTHGRFRGRIGVRDGFLVVNGKEIRLLASADPEELPWHEEGVDVVLESTGRFTARHAAEGHLRAGAGKVVVSAPASAPDISIIMGVNHTDYDHRRHQIISNASCTANCLAPLIKVLDESFGIEKALMTTVHPYTNDQQLHDAPHRDLRRARGAALSMVPTSSGAIDAVRRIFPDLAGKLDGMAIRVPAADVANIDLVAELSRKVDQAELNAAFRKAARGSLKGILGVSDEPLVSCDFRGNRLSSIVDAPCTRVIDGNLVKIVSWYDNESGYSRRLVELIKLVGSAIPVTSRLSI